MLLESATGEAGSRPAGVALQSLQSQEYTDEHLFTFRELSLLPVR